VGSGKRGPVSPVRVSEQGPAIIQDDRFNKRKGRISFSPRQKRERERERTKKQQIKNEREREREGTD
jgi:hypothetical protein